MHDRIFNFENITYDELDLYNSLEHRGIDYVDEIPEKDWPDEIEEFIHLHGFRGLPISKKGNHIKFKYNDMKAYFEKHKDNIDDIYGTLYTEEDEWPLTEYEWMKNLLIEYEGHEIISLVFRQIFDYHF